MGASRCLKSRLAPRMGLFGTNGSFILLPHCRQQILRYSEGHPETFDQTSNEIGAHGGSVSKLDGSVAWREIKKLRLYRASQLWDDSGSFGFWKNSFFFAPSLKAASAVKPETR